jgi:hypothetical protein
LKITKKASGTVLEGFWTREQWRRVFSTRGRHWRRVGSCATARKKPGDNGMLLGLGFLPLSFYFRNFSSPLCFV